MRGGWPAAAALAVILALAVIPAFLPGCRQLTEPKGARRLVPSEIQKVKVMAYYVPRSLGGVHGLASLRENLDRLETVIPFWYSVAADGRVISQADPAVGAEVRRAGKRLVAMVNNLGGNEAPLRDEAIRERAVRSIASLTETDDLDGVNVDFQLIPPEDRQGFTEFVRALREALHRKGKSLEISIFPPVEVPWRINGAYDYRALGKLADRVVLMTYDRHYPSGVPGPVAPLDWVERNVKAAVATMPRSRVYIGVALYGYDWRVESGRRAADIGAAEALELAARTGATLKWDDTAQAPFFRYFDGEGWRHDVWFESADAAVRKFALARTYRVGGVALWRLGFEEEGLWRMIR